VKSEKKIQHLFFIPILPQSLNIKNEKKEKEKKNKVKSWGKMEIEINVGFLDKPTFYHILILPSTF